MNHAITHPRCATAIVATISTLLVILAAPGRAQTHDAGEPITPIVAPFPMPQMQRPTFPDQTFPITDFGAVAGGATLNAGNIQRAIDACSAAGGGTVVVPAGRWLTTPLELKSRVNLHLEADAVLVFTDEKRHYFGAGTRVSAQQDWTQNSLETSDSERILVPVPLISAFECENIAITGAGTVDGQGLGWWPLHKVWWEKVKGQKPGAEAAHERAWRGLDRATWPQRPQLIKPIKCRNVLLEGFTAVDGPFWMINPVACENVIIRRLRIRASWPGDHSHAPNTDGINPESCRNVLVEDCDIDTGDDSIAIKSGRDEAGRRRGMPSENIIIRNINGERIAIGSEMSGGVRNVLIRDCALGGAGQLFHLKTRRGRGGVVENLWLENIEGRAVADALIRVDMEYWTHVIPAPPEPVSERTPRFRNLHFTNIRSVEPNPTATAIFLNGLPEMPLESFSFEKIQISSRRGIVCRHAREVTFADLDLTVVEAPVLALTGCEEVRFTGLHFSATIAPFLHLTGEASHTIRFDATLDLRHDEVVFDGGSTARAVTFDLPEHDD